MSCEVSSIFCLQFWQRERERVRERWWEGAEEPISQGVPMFNYTEIDCYKNSRIAGRVGGRAHVMKGISRHSTALNCWTFHTQRDSVALGLGIVFISIFHFSSLHIWSLMITGMFPYCPCLTRGPIRLFKTSFDILSPSFLCIFYSEIELFSLTHEVHSMEICFSHNLQTF